MPIYKKHRSLSEKTTSIEDPIEVVQRGVISFVPSKGTKFLLPAHIENPVHINLMARSLATRKWLSGGSNASTVGTGFFCDLSLHYATNAASSGFGSIASNVTTAEVGNRLRLVNNKLYVATASMAAGSASNTVVSASKSLWRELELFPSTGKNYLVIEVNSGASNYFKAKKQSLSYEIVGYEY